ncbi:MAG: phosphotransferase [Myxococcota bacterium]
METSLAERIAAWVGPGTAIQALAGGASPRTYWRVRPGQGHAQTASRVVMALPDDPFKPDEAAAAPSATHELPWVAMARALAERGVPVPVVERVDLAAGFLLIEDLGDLRFFDIVKDLSGPARLHHYRDAVALLRRFQTATAGMTVPATFGPDHMHAELDEFRQMALEARLGITLSAGERQLLDRVGADLVRRLDALPRVLAHRDFQSQNLMATGRGLVLIDFQDAFMAPAVYDAVALLRDSYVVLGDAELDALLALAEVDRDAFHLQTIQRKLKDSGRFETLARKGKRHFLAYFADSIGYVVHALRVTGLYPDLLDLLQTRLPEAR